MKKFFLLLLLLSITLLSCEKAFNIIYQQSGFIPRTPLVFPPNLDKRDPIDTIDNWFVKQQLKLSKVCMENSVKSRKKAIQRQQRLDAINWSEEIKKAILQKDELEISNPNKKISKYVSTVGNRVQNARSDIKYNGKFEFYVYKTKSPGFSFNAFALPGGHIFIHDKLVKKLDEAELAFILGHEISHVEWASFDKEILILFGDWSEFKDILSNIGNIAISLCQGPMDEVFIDYFGVILARTAGYDPTAATSLFLNTFNDGLTSNDFNILSSHPPSVVRATYAYYATNDKIKREKSWNHPFYYKGKRGKISAWNGKIPSYFKYFTKR